MPSAPPAGTHLPCPCVPSSGTPWARRRTRRPLAHPTRLHAIAVVGDGEAPERTGLGGLREGGGGEGRASKGKAERRRHRWVLQWLRGSGWRGGGTCRRGSGRGGARVGAAGAAVCVTGRSYPKALSAAGPVATCAWPPAPGCPCFRGSLRGAPAGRRCGAVRCATACWLRPLPTAPAEGARSPRFAAAGRRARAGSGCSCHHSSM